MLILQPPFAMQSLLTVRHFHRLKLGFVLFLLAIVTFLVLPNYWTGQWNWQHLPELPHVQQLRTVQRHGLSLSNWKTLDQREVEIGGHKWSVQAIVPQSQADQATPQVTSLLFLRPQTWARDLPQVDWIDINGAQQWNTDSVRSLEFKVSLPDRTIPVTARFLRGWTEARTYAVLQWYAWTDGGSPAPNRWFWADQMTQLRDRQHLPWTAISLLMPIEPLGNIETALPQLEPLAQQIQSTLLQALIP